MSTLEHPRPEGLLANLAFSQVVVASGARAVYTAGQVSIDERGNVVGPGDLAAQAAQAMRNVGLALAAAGASYFPAQKAVSDAPVQAALSSGCACTAVLGRAGREDR